MTGQWIHFHLKHICIFKNCLLTEGTKLYLPQCLKKIATCQITWNKLKRAEPPPYTYPSQAYSQHPALTNPTNPPISHPFQPPCYSQQIPYNPQFPATAGTVQHPPPFAYDPGMPPYPQTQPQYYTPLPQHQQQTSNMVVLGGQATQIVYAPPRPYTSFACAIVLSVLVFLFCGYLFGLIALILAREFSRCCYRHASKSTLKFITRHFSNYLFSNFISILNINQFHPVLNLWSKQRGYAMYFLLLLTIWGLWKRVVRGGGWTPKRQIEHWFHMASLSTKIFTYYVHVN